MSADGLPPLRDVIAHYGLSAQKSLGQNFLTDLNLTSRIARTAGPLEDTIIYEVGPGPGALTRALLLNGAAKVVAVEKDHRCIAALKDVQAAYPGRLEVIEADALEIDERKVIGDTGGRKIRIAANLPYNIGTALLVKWLSASPWTPWYESITVMLQKEVGQRIVATPRSKAYGRLSVLCQHRTKAGIAFDVPARAFVPPPKVTSCIIRLDPLELPEDYPSLPVLEKVTAAAFNMRRKMLRASLKGLGMDPLPLLEAAEILPTSRAEELTIADFCRLARIYEQGSF